MFGKHPTGTKRVILGNGILIYGTQLLYALLPIILAGIFNEWKAGLILGFFNIFQGFILNPLAGALSDRMGCKPVLLITAFSTFLAGILWIFASVTTIYVLLLFSLLLFTGYIFKNTTEAYLLRSSDRKEGGITFGMLENVAALAFFLVTLSIPLFINQVNHPIIGIILSSTAVIAILITATLPNDKKTSGKKIDSLSRLNPWKTFTIGIDFIRKNELYPLIDLLNKSFESIFFGAIWFVVPLHLAKTGAADMAEGLVLGIYEIATILLAGYIGYLADKHAWHKLFSAGWCAIIIGIIGLPFSTWPFWLVIIGFIIAIGTIMATMAGFHALEYHDHCHRADASYIAFKYTISELLYALSPAIVGFLYFYFGFSASLLFVTASGLILATISFFVLKRIKRYSDKKHISLR